MTYRLVPTKWLRAAQLATLGGTAIVGFSILLTPPNTATTLDVIEDTMNYHYWAWVMIAFALVGLILELWQKVRHHERYFDIISWCHILCCGILSGYAAAALVGVLEYIPWGFGAPTTGALVAFWHLVFVFIRRKPLSS